MRKNIKTFLLFLSVIAFALPDLVSAQASYSTLIQSSLGSQGGLGGLLNNIYLFAISLAAIFAVIKIILGGVKYMLSDVVTTKESAKKDIKTSLLGLIIIAAAVFILQIINPNLTDFDLRFVKPTATAGPTSLSAGGNTAPVGGNVATSYPCATLSGPALNQAGTANITTLDANGCNNTDATAALQAFADDCRRNSNAGYGTSSGGKVGACAVPVITSTTRQIEFPLENYGKPAWYDPKDQYATLQGNLFIYDVVRQCDNETQTQTEKDKCLSNIEDALFETQLISNQIGFCVQNAGTNFSDTGNDYRCTLPTWKTKQQDLRATYEATITGTAQSNWNLDAFRSTCQSEGGTLKDIERWELTGIDDYRCVKYD